MNKKLFFVVVYTGAIILFSQKSLPKKTQFQAQFLKQVAFLKPKEVHKRGSITNQNNEKAEQKPVTEFFVHKTVGKKVEFDLYIKIGAQIRKWQLPKGISINPSHQRIALESKEVHTEAECLFEGVIKTKKLKNERFIVMLWDHGQIHITKHKNTSSLHLTFNGQRLKGTYTLKKEIGKKDTSGWYLQKLADDHANQKKNIMRLFNRSVKTDRTIKQIEIEAHNGN